MTFHKASAPISTQRERGAASQMASPAAIPQALVDELPGRSWTPLTGGGTPASVWRVESHIDDALVVKLLRHGAGSVDGHDSFTFALKARQIARIHSELIALSPYYVRLVGVWRTSTWSAHAMPFYAGRHLGDTLHLHGRNLHTFDRTLRGILRVLTENGYAARSAAPPAEHFRTAHLERMTRRFCLLRTHLGREFVDSGPIMVNGVLCLPAAGLVEQMASDRKLLAELQPGALYYPVHGDLNLGNILVDSASQNNDQQPRFTVLDPRGTLEDWDVVYDFAKMLFSLTVYDLAMQQGFHIRCKRSKQNLPCYSVALRGERHVGYDLAALSFLDTLDSLPFVRAELLGAEPDRWRRRLLFSLASHFVAESACRLSDRKPRSYGDISGWDACIQLAKGLYLLGSLLLSQLYRMPETHDPADVWHLAIPPNAATEPSEREDEQYSPMPGIRP